MLLVVLGYNAVPHLGFNAVPFLGETEMTKSGRGKSGMKFSRGKSVGRGSGRGKTSAMKSGRGKKS